MDSVCPLTPSRLIDLRVPNLAKSYYNLSSVSAGENQGGNPIGKALVSIMWVLKTDKM